jgi:hypothetical protein
MDQHLGNWMVGTAHKDPVASCSMFVSNWGLEDHWKICYRRLVVEKCLCFLWKAKSWDRHGVETVETF